MKKNILIVLSMASALTLSAQINSKERKAALGVIERTYPEMATRLKIKSTDKAGDCDVFHQTADGQRLTVTASSPVAACRGVYDFIRNNEYGIASWTGSRLQLPESFTQSKTRRIVSPFAHHYYFNVVTYGYTMPYWDWQRWEQEIDWMALHGIDMPLALVANEAISARVWKKLGLTDAEIADYFVGPAHLPWMRMGNISGVDGPLPQEWHEGQIELQHKILQRMRSLGMKPICPAFAGFVPKAMKRLYPDIKITETSWGGAFHNWMLSPQEKLFHTIGKMFIEEWEKEFGKNEYYIADSFNEMDIPFPPKEDPTRYTLLASYGEKVYSSIHDGNPDAVWVMQGWMFGYTRHIWDYRTLEALLSRVPDDKMLLLDLAVDYNKCFWHSEVNWEFYKGFFNKPWVYSVIPNMGGKSGMTGILEFYANGHLEALASPNRGRLVAHGMAPEGIENNEVIYELVTDAGWSSEKIDLRSWLKSYSRSRYGTYNQGIDDFWNGMLQSVYGSFTDHPRYNWQFRPGIMRRGTINASPAFYKGIEDLTKTAAQMKGNRLFEYDFREWAVAYAGGKAEWLTQQIEDAYLMEQTERAAQLEQQFVALMEGMDRVLYRHPVSDLQRWIDMARKHSPENKQLADYYEKNARRIVTIWGPPVNDYSARIWSGLIRDYYLPRFQFYFESKRSGKPFDFRKWEGNWVENTKGLSQPKTGGDPFDEAIALVRKAAALEQGAAQQQHVLGNWQAAQGEAESVSEWSVPASRVKALKGLRLHQMRQGGRVKVVSVELIADGKTYQLCAPAKETANTLAMPVRLPAEYSANNECKIRLKVQNTGKTTAAGTLEGVE